MSGCGWEGGINNLLGVMLIVNIFGEVSRKYYQEVDTMRGLLAPS